VKQTFFERVKVFLELCRCHGDNYDVSEGGRSFMEEQMAAGDVRQPLLFVAVAGVRS
jgi:Rieske Fe-S protein